MFIGQTSSFVGWAVAEGFCEDWIGIIWSFDAASPVFLALSAAHSQPGMCTRHFMPRARCTVLRRDHLVGRFF